MTTNKVGHDIALLRHIRLKGLRMGRLREQTTRHKSDQGRRSFAIVIANSKMLFVIRKLNAGYSRSLRSVRRNVLSLQHLTQDKTRISLPGTIPHFRLSPNSCLSIYYMYLEKFNFYIYANSVVRQSNVHLRKESFYQSNFY